MFDLGQAASQSEFFITIFKKTATCNVLSKDQIEVDMGYPLFKNRNNFYFPRGWSIFTINDANYTYYPVSRGNHHCVIFVDDLSCEKIKTAGPRLGYTPMFPEKADVQFGKVLDWNAIAIEILERGAGHTLASGSSAYAVFVVAIKLNLCSTNIKIHMARGASSATTTRSSNMMQKDLSNTSPHANFSNVNIRGPPTSHEAKNSSGIRMKITEEH
jgi:diaminopimelate epimerase